MKQKIASLVSLLEERSTSVLLILFALSLAAFLGTIPLPRVDGMLIGSDGVGYYMYARSLVIDGDIDFANEYTHLRPTRDLHKARTPTGLTGNQYAVGPAILWLPFFLAGHLVSLLLRAVGAPVATDGYSYIYQAAVCVGSIVYGSLGMLLVHRTTRQLFPETALAACVSVWLATSFVYYLIIEPSMSHMCSLFATSVLLYVWVVARPVRSLRHSFFIGLAGGLVGLVRQPDAALLLLPVLDLVLMREPVSDRAKRLAAVMLGFLSVFWLQMLVWDVLNGSPVQSGYFLAGKQGFSWLSPHLAEVLFSTEHGLFLWHPILLIAAIGLLLLLRRDRLLGALLLVGFLSQAYLIASWSAWSQGDAFGGRMFIASLPILTLGLAAFLQPVLSRANRAPWVLLGLGMLVFWNALFVVQYRTGYISMAGPYTLRELTLGKAEMVVDILRRR